MNGIINYTWNKIILTDKKWKEFANSSQFSGETGVINYT